MNYYNSISKSYNKLHKEEQLNKIRLIKDNLEIKKQDFLLDVGCGTGIFAEEFNCIKIGVDPAINLLNQGKNAFYIQASAENLPFKDNSFDTVISVTAIHNFKDIRKCLEEIKRVSRKNIALSILKRSSQIDEIKNYIKELFKITKIIEEDKDIIFFAKR
ncbi:MAG: methyltransferase domain-containing protein [Nanoarchaeota archaeon]|nr:methyltransferase domain-containing protein [Nanoarchaeota archaeon]